MIMIGVQSWFDSWVLFPFPHHLHAVGLSGQQATELKDPVKTHLTCGFALFLFVYSCTQFGLLQRNIFSGREDLVWLCNKSHHPWFCNEKKQIGFVLWGLKWRRNGRAWWLGSRRGRRTGRQQVWAMFGKAEKQQIALCFYLVQAVTTLFYLNGWDSGALKIEAMEKLQSNSMCAGVTFDVTDRNLTSRNLSTWLHFH